MRSMTPEIASQDKGLGTKDFASAHFARSYEEPKVLLWVLLGSTRRPSRRIVIARCCPSSQ